MLKNCKYFIFVEKDYYLSLQPIFIKHKGMINITLPDNTVMQFEKGVSPLDIAGEISEGLARNVIASKVNGLLWDVMRPINDDANVKEWRYAYINRQFATS
jgi:hypothetical protein